MKAELTVPSDCIVFTTRANGDRLTITKAHLDAANAAKLAQMINENGELKIIIKDSEES